jgi:hypothetical protein
MIVVLMRGAVRCMTVRQLYPQDADPSHLCTRLQRRRHSSNIHFTYQSLESNLGIPYHASSSLPWPCPVCKPAHPIFRRQLAHDVPLQQAEAILNYCEVLKKDEDVIGRTRDQWRVCGAVGRRYGLSPWHGSFRVSFRCALYCISKLYGGCIRG